MLTRVDRVQVVVADAEATAAAHRRLLGAEVARQDRLQALAARRTVLALGDGEIELLAPDGAGPVADFLAQTRGGLFAAGFASADLARLRRHLQERGVAVVEEGGQLFVAPQSLGVPGLRCVLSPAAERRRVGLVRGLYEVTLLADDFAALVPEVARVFALEAAHFAPIRSEEFGYEGVLTLFHPDRLDRVEVITPTDGAKTMGRFFARRGPSLYMCYAEAEDLRPIRDRALEHAPGDWTGPGGEAAPDNLFLHPKALGGMMLGVSRDSVAWRWSGRPERVDAGARE